MFGIKKDKKEKKKKKFWNKKRLKRWLVFGIFIVVIVLSVREVFGGCSCAMGNFYRIAQELAQPYDYTLMLSSNRIKAGDRSSLYEEIGPNGADLPIFIGNNVDGQVYASVFELSPMRDFTLADYELGVFCGQVINDGTTDIMLEILELTIDANMVITIVAKMDLSKVTDELPGQFSEIKTIYTKSTGICEVKNNIFYISDVKTQVNDLSEEDNESALLLISTVDKNGTQDMVTTMVKDIINVFALKTMAEMTLGAHYLQFVI